MCGGGETGNVMDIGLFLFVKTGRKAAETAAGNFYCGESD
jgi:hypothetical protein